MVENQVVGTCLQKECEDRVESKLARDQVFKLALNVNGLKESKKLLKSLEDGRYPEDIIYDTHIFLGIINYYLHIESENYFTIACKYLNNLHRQTIRSHKQNLRIPHTELSKFAQDGWRLVSQDREIINVLNVNISKMSLREKMRQFIMITMRICNNLQTNWLIIGLLDNFGSELADDVTSMSNDAMNIWLFSLEYYILQETRLFDRDKRFISICMMTIDRIIKSLERMFRKAMLINADILHNFIGSLLRYVEFNKQNKINLSKSGCEQTKILGVSIERSLLILAEYIGKDIACDDRVCKLIDKVIRINPIDNKDNSILHNLFNHRLFNGHHRLDNNYIHANSSFVELVKVLVNRGFPLDIVNKDKKETCLQTLCNSIISHNWFHLTQDSINQLFEVLLINECHIDVDPQKPHVHWRIRKYLEELGINPLKYTKLSCLAARTINKYKINFDSEPAILPNDLSTIIKMHPSEHNTFFYPIY